MALSCIVPDIKRDIGRKSQFFHTPLHSTNGLAYGGPNMAPPEKNHNFGRSSRKS